MATVAEFDKFFETYNPSGGGREEWNMWCQAFVARCCKFDGNWKRDYLTARAARLASGPLSKDMSNIPIGAFGYWYWAPDDDVAIYIGGGRWMRGSRHVTTQFGGVARNAGTGSFESFQSSARLPFLGWSKTNGGNTVNVTTLTPAGGNTTPLIDSDESENTMTIRYLYTKDAGDSKTAYGIFGEQVPGGSRISRSVSTAEVWGAIWGTEEGAPWKEMTKAQWPRLIAEARVINEDWVTQQRSIQSNAATPLDITAIAKAVNDDAAKRLAN